MKSKFLGMQLANGWEVTAVEDVKGRHKVFLLEGPIYQNKRGTFRECIRLRDNILTKIKNNREAATKIINRKIDRWVHSKDSYHYDIVCVSLAKSA